MSLENEKCSLCRDFADLMHHTSYEPSEKVPLCSSCHKKVHSNKDHNLYPEDEGKYSSMTISRSIKQKLDDWADENCSRKDSYSKILEKLIAERAG